MIDFGKKITIATDDNGNQRKTIESYSDNKKTKERVYFILPHPVTDKSQALSECIKAIELCEKLKLQDELVIRIQLDKSSRPKIVVKEYEQV